MKRLLIVASCVLISSVALAHLAGQIGESAFPGDNGKIAFVSVRDGDFEIYAMNPDGSNQVNLTDDVAHDSDPAWSADGSKLAYSRSIVIGQPDIVIMNADGSGKHQITSTGDASDPSWSPHDKIAFTSVPGSNQEVFSMNSDGTGQTNLTNNSADDSQPAWSPDGFRIAFVRWDYAPNNYEIYVMNADGSGQSRLTDNDVVNGQPSWSPDGSKIAFTSDFAIHTMNADGSGEVKLSGEPTSHQSPAWSSDGTKIALADGSDGTTDISVINVDGTGLLTLTSNEGNRQPDWQPIVLQPASSPTIQPTPTVPPSSPTPDPLTSPIPPTPTVPVAALPNTGGTSTTPVKWLNLAMIGILAAIPPLLAVRTARDKLSR